MKRSRGRSVADVKSRFGVAPVIARCLRSVIEQTPSTLVNNQAEEWAALRRGGGCDLDHDVSIQTSFAEKLRGARPNSNASMTIMRPPQHGQECEGEVGSTLPPSLMPLFWSGWTD